MEANSKNFSILVENEEQFNRVWAYVRYYHPTTPEVNYSETKPIAVRCSSNYSFNSYSMSKHFDKFYYGYEFISWKQFLEYEKKMEKKEEQKVIPIKKALEQLSKEKKNKELIASLIKKINILISNLPDNEALKVTFNSEGEDMKFYLDNLTKFTSLKSIFNSKELL